MRAAWACLFVQSACGTSAPCGQSVGSHFIRRDSKDKIDCAQAGKWLNFIPCPGVSSTTGAKWFLSIYTKALDITFCDTLVSA